MAIRRSARAVYDSKYHMAWDAEMATQRLSLMKRDAKGMPMGLNSPGVSFTNKGWQFTSIQIKRFLILFLLPKLNVEKIPTKVPNHYHQERDFLTHSLNAPGC